MRELSYCSLCKLALLANAIVLFSTPVQAQEYSVRERAPVYESPLITSKRLAQLGKESPVHPIKEEGGWIEIESPIHGFVRRSDLVSPGEATKVEKPDKPVPSKPAPVETERAAKKRTETAPSPPPPAAARTETAPSAARTETAPAPPPPAAVVTPEAPKAPKEVAPGPPSPPKVPEYQTPPPAEEKQIPRDEQSGKSGNKTAVVLLVVIALVALSGLFVVIVLLAVSNSRRLKLVREVERLNRELWQSMAEIERLEELAGIADPQLEAEREPDIAPEADEQ